MTASKPKAGFDKNGVRTPPIPTKLKPSQKKVTIDKSGRKWGGFVRTPYPEPYYAQFPFNDYLNAHPELKHVDLVRELGISVAVFITYRNEGRAPLSVVKALLARHRRDADRWFDKIRVTSRPRLGYVTAQTALGAEMFDQYYAGREIPFGDQPGAYKVPERSAPVDATNPVPTGAAMATSAAQGEAAVVGAIAPVTSAPGGTHVVAVSAPASELLPHAFNALGDLFSVVALQRTALERENTRLTDENRTLTTLLQEQDTTITSLKRELSEWQALAEGADKPQVTRQATAELGQDVARNLSDALLPMLSSLVSAASKGKLDLAEELKRINAGKAEGARSL